MDDTHIYYEPRYCADVTVVLPSEQVSFHLHRCILHRCGYFATLFEEDPSLGIICLATDNPLLESSSLDVFFKCVYGLYDRYIEEACQAVPYWRVFIDGKIGTSSVAIAYDTTKRGFMTEDKSIRQFYTPLLQTTQMEKDSTQPLDLVKTTRLASYFACDLVYNDAVKVLQRHIEVCDVRITIDVLAMAKEMKLKGLEAVCKDTIKKEVITLTMGAVAEVMAGYDVDEEIRAACIASMRRDLLKRKELLEARDALENLPSKTLFELMLSIAQ